MSDVDESLVCFTQFSQARSLEGVEVKVPWRSFCEFLLEEGFLFLDKDDKNKAPLLVPVLWDDEATFSKAKEYVAAVTMVFLDFDELTHEEAEEVVAKIEELDYSAFLYTTWGHAKALPLYKFRAVFPVTRPLTTEEWEVFQPKFNSLLGGYADPACSDVSRGYFMPSVPKGTDPDLLSMEFLQGSKALPVDKILKQDIPIHLKKQKKRKERKEKEIESKAETESLSTDKGELSRIRLEHFAKKLTRSPNEYRAYMGKLLLKVLAGEPFADKGDRDNTIYKLAKDLGEHYVNYDPHSIAEFFEASLNGMGPDCPTVEVVADKIYRAQREAKDKREQAKLKDLESLGVAPYTKATIEEFLRVTKAGTKFKDFQRRLIIYRGGRCYVYFDGDYIEMTEKDLLVACRDYFVPAEELFGASVFNVGPDGRDVPKQVSQLLSEYGCFATDEEVDLTASRSYFRESDRTMVISRIKRSELMPERNYKVDKWIDELCGDEVIANKLREWMVMALDLSKPISMLIFLGETGIGKTSFVRGLGRVWKGGGVANLKNALENHNTQLLNSPLLFSDEKLPLLNGKYVDFGLIRSLISADTHQVNPKMKNLMQVNGFYRLISALNNADDLKFGKGLNKAEVAAIKQRLFVVECKNTSSFDYKDFVTDGGIAKHVLWLKDNLNVERERFGVSHGSVSEVAYFQEDERALLILKWVLWFLTNRRLEEAVELPAFITKGRIFVSPSLMADNWYGCHSERVRLLGQMEAAKVLISLSRGQVRVKVGNKRLRYQEVDLNIFFAYLDFCGMDLDRRVLDKYTTSLYERAHYSLPDELELTEEDKLKHEEAIKLLENS